MREAQIKTHFETNLKIDSKIFEHQEKTKKNYTQAAGPSVIRKFAQQDMKAADFNSQDFLAH
jgi:hypothetical protein